MAEALGADYWLTGPDEDGYGPELDRLLAATTCRVHRRVPAGLTMDDAYAACDAVVFPSTWEGFGAPLVEASLHRRPLAVGDYPVAAELAAFGFRWFPADDPTPLKAFLDHPDPALLAANHDIARRRFSLDALTGQLAALLADAGWGLGRARTRRRCRRGRPRRPGRGRACGGGPGRRTGARCGRGGPGRRRGRRRSAHSAMPRRMPSVISACSRRNRVTRLARRGAFSRISW